MSDDTGGFSARQIEAILRDGGVSKRLAREIIAHGFKSATQNDTGTDPDALATKLRAATAILRGTGDE